MSRLKLALGMPSLWGKLLGHMERERPLRGRLLTLGKYATGVHCWACSECYWHELAQSGVWVEGDLGWAMVLLVRAF